MTGATILSGSLRTLFGVGTLSGLTDGQLLERYLRGRAGVGEAVAEAEAAFAGLVERHGPMVLNVCRAVLGDRHDAEDACQATFLVLARRAEWIRRGDSVASWLYGVARRIAARARRDLARRRELERRRLERMRSSDLVSAPAEPWPELYEELDRLPEPFRAAVVLCDLEGHSYEQAAGLLSCPVGTLQSRLARGRARLRHRLERRGIAPATVLIGIGAELAARPAAAALVPPWAAAIARAAIAIGAGRTIAGAAPAAVAAMAGTEIRRQVMNRLATTVTTLLVAGLMATAAIGLAAGGRGGGPQQAQPGAAAEKKSATGPIHVRVVDLDGEAAAGVAVESRGWDQPSRSFTTDADGRVTVPRDPVSDPTALIARRGRDAVAWGIAGGSELNRPAGTEGDPIVMKLLPIDHGVEGSVVDREGHPVAGVEMRLFILSHPINGQILYETILQGLVAPGVTDRSGRYTMQLPRESQASLKSWHPRYVGPGVGVQPDARALDREVLEPAGSIVGRVIDAATGRPVAGALVGAQFVEHRDSLIGGEWLEAESDDHGRFVLGGTHPGVYNVLFNGLPGRPGATARAVESVRVRADADTPAELTIIEGRPLRGVVIDRDTGSPVSGTRVGCSGPARPRSGFAVESHATDDRGRFTFYVPPGEHYVYIQEGGYRNRLARQTVVIPEQGKIELVRLMRQAVRNQGMMGLMQKAVAKDDVAKVAGPPPTEVGAVQEAKAAVPKPEPAVRKAMMKAEAYTKAIKPARAKARQEQAGAPADAPKVRTVTGHVRDPQGRPLAGVQLQASSDAGFRSREFHVTDREGMFLFPSLPREPLTISLIRRGYRYQDESLPADRDEVDWTFGLLPDSEAKNRPGPPQDEPIPPELRDRLIFVDLQPWGTDYLTDGPGEGGNDLNRLPRGVHRLGETYFRIGEKMVHVQGRMRPDLPRSVKGIAVRARGRVLHFLHSTQGGADMDGKIVGAYVIHYADGSSERVPLVYARDITNWWHRDPGRPISEAKPAWTGLNDAVERHTRPGLMVRLFDLAWTNPHPEKEIATLDVLSAGKECDPFLVAVTIVRP